MGLSRRLAALLAILSLTGFVAGLGAGDSLALLTDSESVAGVFTTAASFDTVPPTVASSVVSKTVPYVPGYITQGGTYHIYANVTDGGASPSGVSTVTANTSSFDTGMTAVALVAGSYSIGGVAYNYRSAQLPFGTVNLVGLSYVTANRDFGASGTPSSMVIVGNAIVITLGTASGAVGTESVAAAMVWTPVTGAHDRAGLTCQTTAATEATPLDLDF